MRITDDTIRDRCPSVEVLPSTKDTRRLAAQHPGQILFRVTPNKRGDLDGGWWDLDDLARAVLHGRWVGYQGWNLIYLEDAYLLVAAFDAVGELARVEFRAIHDEEKAPVTGPEEAGLS